MIKKILLTLLALLVIGIAVGVYMYNKPHRDIANEDPIYTGDISGLQEKLTQGDSIFNYHFADEVVVLNGSVTSVSESSFSFENVVICTPDSTVGIAPFERGKDMTIKGRVVGAEEDFIEGFIIRMDFVQPIQ